MKEEKTQGRKKFRGYFLVGPCDEDQNNTESSRNIVKKLSGAIFNKNHWIWWLLLIGMCKEKEETELNP